jgi:F-type H+-transporting ATPase subunit b
MINSMMIMAAAAEQEQANPLIPNIWEIIVTSVGFLVLLFIVIKFVVPAMEKSYVERRDAIEGGLERAQAAQAEAAQLKNNYEHLLQEARTEASQIREQARTEAAQIVAEARQNASAEASRISEQASVQIAAERQQTVAALRTEVGTLATQLASKIVGEALEDDARSQRVVDRFLEDLEKEQASTTSAGATE